MAEQPEDVALSDLQLELMRVLWKKLVSGEAILGWASVMTSVLFLGGIQLIAIGIIGEYVGRVYNETKRRPGWIVSSRNNLPSATSSADSTVQDVRQHEDGS